MKTQKYGWSDLLIYIFEMVYNPRSGWVPQSRNMWEGEARSRYFTSNTPSLASQDPNGKGYPYAPRKDIGCPFDGEYTWVSEKDRDIGEKRDDWYYCKYTEGPGDRAFMEKTDWEYIRQLEAKGRLLKEEPNADREIARDHAFRGEIEQALQRARQAFFQKGKGKLAPLARMGRWMRGESAAGAGAGGGPAGAGTSAEERPAETREQAVLAKKEKQTQEAKQKAQEAEAKRQATAAREKQEKAERERRERAEQQRKAKEAEKKRTAEKERERQAEEGRKQAEALRQQEKAKQQAAEVARKQTEEAKRQATLKHQQEQEEEKEQKQLEQTLEAKTQEIIEHENQTTWNPAVFVQTLTDVSELKRVITSSEIHQSISASHDDLVRLSEQALIMQNPVLDEYYHYFLLLLKGILSAATVVHTRLVACADTKFQKKGGVTQTAVTYGLQALDKLGKNIPFAGVVSGILLGGMKLYQEPQKKRLVNALASFLHSAEEVSTFTETLARQLTISKRQKLEQLIQTGELSEKDCIFAEKAHAFFSSAKQNAIMVFDKLRINDINTPIRKLAESDCERIVRAIGENPDQYSRLTFSDMGRIFQIVMGAETSYESPVTEDDISQIREPGKLPIVTGSVYATLSGKTAPPPPQKQDSTKTMLLAMEARMQAMEQKSAQDAKKIADLEAQQASQQKVNEEALNSLRQENQALREMMNTDPLAEQISQHTSLLATLKQQLEVQGEKADQSTADTLQAELKKVNALNKNISDKQHRLDAAQRDQARKISQIPTDFLANSGETMLTSQDFEKNNKKLQAFRANVLEMRAMLETLLGKTLEHEERLDDTQRVVETMDAKGKGARRALR